MKNQLEVGSKIPSFSIKDFEGIEIQSEDLLGSPFVLYFYPKDETPGCTTEACGFRDNMISFDDLETLVFGVSPDNAASHQKFIQHQNLNFTLLCDENMELALKFHVVKEKEIDEKKSLSILRSTFIIDANGIICWMESPVVDIEGHAVRVLKALNHYIDGIR